MADTDSDIQDASAPASRRWNWRRGAQWFGAEFLVVVTGVLVALALNAWWQDRQAVNLEQDYLCQLAADLRETEQAVARADSSIRASDLAGATVVRSFQTPERPPRDSVLAWLDQLGSYAVTRPVLGTAQALVTTGDLTLVRDDSLRTEITSYLETAQVLTGLQDQLAVDLQALYNEVATRVDPFEMRLSRSTPQELDSLAAADPLWVFPAGPWRRPFPFDVDAFMESQPSYDALYKMAVAKRNLRRLRSRIRESAADLRRRVERELDD